MAIQILIKEIDERNKLGDTDYDRYNTCKSDFIKALSYMHLAFVQHCYIMTPNGSKKKGPPSLG